MPVSWFDLSLIVIVGGFALFGFWFGFIHTAGSLIGTLAGAYIASRYYELLAQWLMHITGWEGNTARVVMFILAFLIISRLIGFAFWIVDRILSIITRLPFVSSINRILGVALGFLEGVMTVGLILFFVERFPLSDKIMEMIAQSEYAPKFRSVADVFIPLLPDALKLLKSTVDYVQHTFK
jgi:membrane protein required for colicin V production